MAFPSASVASNVRLITVLNNGKYAQQTSIENTAQTAPHANMSSSGSITAAQPAP